MKILRNEISRKENDYVTSGETYDVNKPNRFSDNIYFNQCQALIKTIISNKTYINF